MIGLLLKDLMGQRRLKVFFIGVFIFVALIIPSGEIERFLSSIVGVLAMVSGLTILSVMALDDYSKWTIFAASMPISRRTIIVEKYLFAILLVLAMDLIFILLGMIAGDLTKIWGALLFYDAFTLWYILTYCPFRVFFAQGHTENASAMVYPILLVSPIALQLVIGKRVDRLAMQEMMGYFLGDPMRLSIVLGVVVLLLLISMEISVRGFQKKDL
ncbi:MAG: ABC-2 transporter permease [Peptostreptococcaceae bacterium]|nr:ABC-2 transporter permease [Peptostreptococcaceae bacterium]